jgi:RHS repeat-associated protein
MGYTKTGTNAFTQYVYDQNGQRILKGGISNASVAVNGQSGPLSLSMTPYTLYVNPYYVTQEFSANSVTSKHYYMGAQRVATNMGGAEELEPGGLGEPTMNKTNATNTPLLNNIQLVLKDFGKEAGTDYEVQDLLQVPDISEYYQDSTQTMKTSGNGGGVDPYTTPRVVYYYHPDYLGNVEYITDANGLPYQYFWYSPWGETLKEEPAAISGWSSPYRFNGKEQDEETGLYYYGARYYNPQVSLWLSVDAMASKAHNLPLSPYNFSANNPIMYVDPDGNDWFENSETGQILYVKGVSDLSETEIDYGDGWTRIGEDDMFGSEIIRNNENILERYDFEFGVVEAESFMNSQGFKKGERVQRKSVDHEVYIDDDGTGKTRTLKNKSDTQVGDSEITYVKPEQFGKKENSQVIRESDDNQKTIIERYSIVVPYRSRTTNSYIDKSFIIQELFNLFTILFF